MAIGVPVRVMLPKTVLLFGEDNSRMGDVISPFGSLSSKKSPLGFSNLELKTKKRKSFRKSE
jgi:hypothetical protein